MSKDDIRSLKDSLQLPVIMAPMFLVSNPTTVLEACKNGIIGSFPTLNARTNEILDEWMGLIKQNLNRLEEENPEKVVAPWAINFIAHKSHNKRYDEDLQLIKKHQPPIVITSLGDPSPIAKIVHSYGGMVLSDVIDTKFAKKAIEKGSDGLILITSGAGGHGGTLNPIAFIHEVQEFFEGPIILGGTISKGEDILAAEILGADFVYMGTRFIASHEAGVTQDYKEMLIHANIHDIIYTAAFSGVHANYLIPSLVKAGIHLDELPKEGKMKLENPDIRAWRDIWSAGQGVGTVRKIQTIEEIINELKVQYKMAKEKISLK